MNEANEFLKRWLDAPLPAKVVLGIILFLGLLLWMVHLKHKRRFEGLRTTILGLSKRHDDDIVATNESVNRMTGIARQRLDTLERRLNLLVNPPNNENITPAQATPQRTAAKPKRHRRKGPASLFERLADTNDVDPEGGSGMSGS